MYVKDKRVRKKSAGKRAGVLALAVLFASTASFGYFLPRHTAAAPGDLNYEWTALNDGQDGASYAFTALVKPAPGGGTYNVGIFDGTVDFDPTAGTDIVTSIGSQGSFVQKLNADGSYGWTRIIDDVGIGGNVVGMEVASDGSVFVAGTFDGTVDFDPDGAGDVRTASGITEPYLMKLNANGSYSWTRTLALNGAGGVYEIELSSDGGMYWAGVLAGTADFNPDGAGDVQSTAGNNDGFVTRYESDGSYGWTNVYGGTDSNPINSIETDSDGNVYALGDTNPDTIDFDTGAGTDQWIFGEQSIMLIKIQPDGSHVWAKAFGYFGNPGGWAGSTANSVEQMIFIDDQDAVYVGGRLQGTIDVDTLGPGAFLQSGIGEFFIAKTNSDGSHVWARKMGDVTNATLAGGALNADGDIFLTGRFAATVDFDPGGSGDSETATGNHDIYMSRINADGSYGWTNVTNSSPSAEPQVMGIAVDDANGVYANGHFNLTADFNPGGTADAHTSAANDMYLMSFDQDGTYRDTRVTETGAGDTMDLSLLSFDPADDSLYVPGFFVGTIDFDPQGTGDVRNSTGLGAGFVMKLSIEAGSGGPGPGPGGGGSGGSGGGGQQPAGSSGGGSSLAEDDDAPGTDNFEFDVNLSDGMEVGPGEYPVIVTSLPGSGLEFEKVEFYVGDKLVYTALPDGTGQFTWPWDTTTQPGGIVRIVVYETGGGTSSKQFVVQVKRPAAVPAAPTGRDLAGSVSFMEGLWQRVDRVVRLIPPAGIHSFPYWLFLLLALLALILFLQGLREAAEVNNIEKQLQRDKLLNNQKATFVQLASHYLRTPVTIIKGAPDMGDALHEGKPEVWRAIAGPANSLGAKVEELLGRATRLSAGRGQVVTMAEEPPVRLWKRPGFIVPVALVGFIALAANVLAGMVGQISLPVLNIIGQIVVFAIATALLYAVMRAGVLRKGRRERLLHARREEAAIDEARDGLIRQAVGELAPYLAAIREKSRALGAGKAAGLLAGGCTRIESVLSRFTLALKLGAGKPASEPVEISLQQLVGKAAAAPQTQAAAKRVTIDYPADRRLWAANPELLTMALASVIDNAVAYSPEGGRVTIAADGEVLAVRDNGPGIQKESLGLLMQPFSRADDILKFSHEGMGFSLYLDKLIMTHIGGAITIDSAPGRGTEVALSTQPAA